MIDFGFVEFLKIESVEETLRAGEHYLEGNLVTCERFKVPGNLSPQGTPAVSEYIQPRQKTNFSSFRNRTHYYQEYQHNKSSGTSSQKNPTYHASTRLGLAYEEEYPSYSSSRHQTDQEWLYREDPQPDEYYNNSKLNKVNGRRAQAKGPKITYSDNTRPKEVRNSGWEQYHQSQDYKLPQGMMMLGKSSDKHPEPKISENNYRRESSPQYDSYYFFPEFNQQQPYETASQEEYDEHPHHYQLRHKEVRSEIEGRSGDSGSFSRFNSPDNEFEALYQDLEYEGFFEEDEEEGYPHPHHSQVRSGTLKGYKRYYENDGYSGLNDTTGSDEWGLQEPEYHQGRNRPRKPYVNLIASQRAHYQGRPNSRVNFSNNGPRPIQEVQRVSEEINFAHIRSNLKLNKLDYEPDF